MGENTPPYLNLSVKDHVKLIKAIIENEEFQQRMLEDPEGTLSETIGFTQEELDALPDDNVTMPSIDELRILVARLESENRMGEYPFEVVNILC